jgi:hypothetical protein
MFIKGKRDKWLCYAVVVAMLLTAAFTLPFATDTAEEAYADIYGDYTYEVLEGSATITGYYGDRDSIDIPSQIGENNYPVKAIGDSAFNSRYSLINVTIPSSVTSIGDYAFSSCSKLASVIIPDSVTSIGEFAFIGCNSLINIFIPNSVTSIGECAFYACISLKSINIPTGVTSIEGYTFQECSSLISMTIPSNVTSIGAQAFVDCSSLTSVTIPNSVVSIAWNAFLSCPNLRLKVYSGSYAQSYAIENGVPYDLIDAPVVVYPVVTPAAPTVQPAPKAAPAAPKKLAAPTAKVGKKQIKITWKKSATKGISGYEVQYRIVGKKWAMKKIGAKATSLTIKKLKPGKRYEVRVRALKKSGGKTAYGAWSKTIKSGKVKR